MTKTLIALAEDNPLNRLTFIDKISLCPDLEIVFIAEDGNDFLEQIKGLPYSKHPQVVFMDIEMPGFDGIQTINIARSLYNHIHFIVLTVFDDDDKIFEAIQAGAIGYLLKDESAVEINNAIINVLKYGGSPMSPAIARKTLQLLGRSTAPEFTETKAVEIDNILSDREKDILKQVIHGHDAKRIGEILNISVLTVRKHIANIYQKLHVNSRAQIMHLAHDRKWFK